ncbi:hypothetical protein O181_067961 [Austropuccinia psidii MF-1]|uniref:Uncharacterized protein n=1 Tax=Austropuccinia psidii MF-1 TaxID=1389203 RepID=A0A9Q3F0P9_9BASI|nr:hypothetical protein [Austropuccinia psidii MF-1]
MSPVPSAYTQAVTQNTAPLQSCRNLTPELLGGPISTGRDHRDRRAFSEVQGPRLLTRLISMLGRPVKAFHKLLLPCAWVGAPPSVT